MANSFTNNKTLPLVRESFVTMAGGSLAAAGTHLFNTRRVPFFVTESKASLRPFSSLSDKRARIFSLESEMISGGRGEEEATPGATRLSPSALARQQLE